MATCNYIPAKKQTRGAMQAVIRYVSQDMKTLDERGRRYLTGINCLAPAAYDEFMATKNLYGKRDGVMYYHYEQSFAPGEIDDYDTAHEIGLKLAGKCFPASKCWLPHTLMLTMTITASACIIISSSTA